MKFKLISLLLLSEIFFSVIMAQPVLILSEKQNEYSLNPYLGILEDPTGKLTIDQIISDNYNSHFKPVNDAIPNYGHTQSAIWTKFKLVGNSNSNTTLPWALEIKFAHIHYIDFYLFTNNDLVDSLKIGSMRSIEYHYPVIFLKPGIQIEYTVYMRFKSEASLTIPLVLYSIPQFVKQNHREDIINGLFIGIMLIMLIVNLFAFYSLKDESYLYFCLSILAFIFYSISYTGFAVLYLWPGQLQWNYLSIPFFLILTNMLFVKFADSFLQAKIRMVKWHYIFNGVIIINGLLFIILGITNYRFVITPIMLLILFSLILIFVAVFISWRNGFLPARFFLISYVVLLIGAFVFSLVRFGILPSIIGNELGMHIGSVVYVLLMSLALRNRIMTLVSEKEKSEKSLQKSEDRFRALVETSRDVIWEVDTKGRYTYISPTIELVLGYQPQELIGKTSFNLMPEEEAKRVSEFFYDIVSKKQPLIQQENINFHKNGTQIVLESSGVPFFDEKGILLGYRGIDRDITMRKQAIEERIKSEGNLKALLNATTEVAFLIDAEYKIITANESLAVLFGKSVEELINSNVLDQLQSDIAAERKPKLDEVSRSGKPVRWQDNDVSGWWDNSIYPITDSNGVVTNLAIFSRDITEQKKAELVREVMLNIANAVLVTKNMTELYKSIHSEINRMIDAENFFVGLYNDKEDIITMPYFADEKEDFTGINIPLKKTLSAQVIINKKPMLFKREDMLELDRQGIVGSGYGIPSLLWLGVPLLDNNKVIGLIVIQSYENENAYTESDLSLMEFVSKQISISIKKKQSEEEIRVLSQSVEQSPAIIMITNLDGIIEYVNPRFSEITGYSSDEAIGQKPSLLKSGETSMATYEKLWNTIKRGEEWRGEFHNKKKNGDLYWEDTYISPIKDENREITRFLAIKEDSTEQKKLQQQLIQSQKMEAIGTLAGGIAHDFNNLLTVINGFSEIALMKTEKTSPIHKDITAILSASKRAEKLTRQILAFSRKQIYQPKIISINEIITGLENMIHRLIGEDIIIKMDFTDNLPFIKADPGQIEQILMNLIVNARDAINQKTFFQEQKKIIIKTNKIYLDEENSNEQINSPSKLYVYFSVSDNGTGIPDKVKQYIFDPFFTTKDTGKGTGLGLATTYGIVKQNNGIIHFHSKVGEGTEFLIYWLATDEESFHKSNTKVINDNLAGNETILFVEDDQNLRKFAETALQEFGYIVLTASNGKEALDVLKNNSQINLLITDFVMPDMNGKKLSNESRIIKPEIPIIVISGYTRSNLSMDDNISFLQKPFSVHALLSKVREILDI